MKPYYGEIYVAMCLDNHKLYVGQTSTGIEIRKRQHINDSKRRCKTYFHKAIASHGQDRFIWRILDTAMNKNDMNEKEKYWIKVLDTTNYKSGYNLSTGGDGVGFTEEIKAKISKSLTGKKQSSETIEKRVLSRGYFTQSDETKKRISKGHMGIPSWAKGLHLSEQHRKRISLGQLGKHMSEESKVKMSIAKKGKPWTEARRIAQENRRLKCAHTKQ